MPKLIEVEVRILLKNRKKIEEKIKEQGCKLIYYTHLIDHWYCPKNIKNYKDASTDNIGYALRIRETRDEYANKNNYTLECKTLCKGVNHAYCNENEIDISDISQTKNILDSIGQKEFLLIDKERVIYKLSKIKYCFDNIKGLGDGLELELMTPKEKLEEAHKKLLETAYNIGITKEEILEKSLTYLAMKKISKF